MQWRFSRGWALLAALVLWSCQPSIGGYCTKFGCSADSCPSEAACIGYQTLVSIAPECANLQVRPRLQRTACMLSCDKDKDCRGGYVCVDLAQTNPWGALLIDRSGSAKVCTLPPPPEPVGETGVCQSQPAPLEPLPVPAPPVSDAGLDSATDAD